MSKILVIKGKKKFFEDLDKEVTLIKEKSFFIEDTKKPFSTKYGTISVKDLKKTGTIKSNTNKEFSIFNASFIDSYKRLKKLPQIIPLKDIGMILATTGVGPKSTVVEGGSGSGALAIMLARHVKSVVSYEVRDDHHEVAKENAKNLGLKNIDFKLGSMYDKIDEKDVDLICFDLPEPWEALATADVSLKIGGFIVSYSPTIPQTQDFVNNILEHPNFLHLKTIDIIEQEWQVDGRKVRPKSKQIIHSGFLSFARKVQ